MDAAEDRGRSGEGHSDASPGAPHPRFEMWRFYWRSSSDMSHNLASLASVTMQTLSRAVCTRHLLDLGIEYAAYIRIEQMCRK
jgi:hypothetical protein